MKQGAIGYRTGPLSYIYNMYICNCVMMTEKETIEGGQKDFSSLEGTTFKKILVVTGTYVSKPSSSFLLALEFNANLLRNYTIFVILFYQKYTTKY